MATTSPARPRTAVLSTQTQPSKHKAGQIGRQQPATLGQTAPGSGTWAVTHRESGAFLGMVGFSEPEGWPGLELAWTLVRRAWGHGYATEAARAALDYAFTVWKRDRVISLIYPGNDASIRVAERLGETLQGRIDHYGREMLCYGIDRATYLREVAPVGVLALRAG